MNSILMNEVNKGGRPEQSEGVGFGKPAKQIKLKFFLVVLYIYFNSFKSLLVLGVSKWLIYLCYLRRTSTKIIIVDTFLIVSGTFLIVSVTKIIL